MAEFTLDDLNTKFRDWESSWMELFAEQRSNILLNSGYHYSKNKVQAFERLKDQQAISGQQKIRFTENHIQKVTKAYVNYILSASPGVGIYPHTEGEIQDQKAAELHSAAFSSVKKRLKLKAQARSEARDYVELGEVACKVFWDPNAGRFLGNEQVQKLDEMGQPLMNPDGTFQVEEFPVFEGDLVCERILGFNILIDPSAKTFDEADVIIRKMVPISKLKKALKDQPELVEKISETKNDTFQIFDSVSGSYKNAKGQAELREFYKRPCPDYPTGYFVYFTDKGILAQGELPDGLFPIVFKEFDEIKTTARGSGIIRPIRPVQGEVNRCASKIIEHHLTLGDDKIITSSGSTMTQGGVIHGVRAIQVSGMAPTVLEGRSGSQYVDYMNSKIAQIYRLVDLPELDEDKPVQVEPLQQIYQSMRKKKKFSLYAEKFAEYQIEKAELILKTLKNNVPDTMLIPMIGRNERVNIAEFRNAEPLHYQIRLEEVDDDVDSVYGKQLALNQVIQYVGTEIGKDDLGKIIRAMPFLNKEEGLSDLTMSYDNAKNTLLALDRGEWSEPLRGEDHEYMIKKLSNRMKQPDFKFLSPEKQQMYAAREQLHQQMAMENLEKIKAAQSEFIPTSGFMVGCDFYVPSPNNPAATKRVRIPADSINWLINHLEKQGSALQKLEALDRGTLAAMSESSNQQPQMQQLPGQVVLQGQANPEGIA